MICKWRCVVDPVLVFLIAAVLAPEAVAGERTERLLERLGVKRGICVVLGDPSCELAMRLGAARRHRATAAGNSSWSAIE